MMKFLIPIFLIFSIIPAHSQEMDKFYYILGYNFDLSYPLHYQGDLKKVKMAFEMSDHDMSKVYRFSEVTGLKFKKRRAEKDCLNCHQFYRFTKIDPTYKLNDYYYFTYTKVKEYYHGFGEVEEEKQHGFLKPSVLKNITEQQMKSYLAGAYLEAGVIKGDTVKFVFHQSLNQKLTLIKEFIEKIEEPRFFKVIHRKDENHFYGPTLLLVPNKILWNLFKNEEDRKHELLTSHNFSKN